MWLTIVSLVVNGLFLLIVFTFLSKPELFNSALDKNFKSRHRELQKHYQDEENKLQRKLAEETKNVTNEIFELRRKLESDINNEVEGWRQQKHLEINRTIEERIAALRERQKHQEEEVMRRFEEFKFMYDIQKQQIEQKLESLKSLEASAVEARVRQYEELNKEKFYMIQIEDSDAEEIEELLHILPKLKNAAALRKAIFDIYYKQPVRDMTYRVVGSDSRPSGIYKITYVDTGECYIGQSVDIRSRFLQHIKGGFGLDGAASSKLYAAMNKYGLHSFKFEVIERCEEYELSEKEKYWADYFKSKEFGFSIKN